MVIHKAFLLLSLCVATAVNAQPSNDNPCTAIVLPLNSSINNSCVSNNTQSWTAATSNPAYLAPGCGTAITGNNMADVWFSFTPLLSGNVVINTTAGSGTDAITDAAMAVYHAPGCGVPAQFVLDQCNDDSGGISRMPFINMPVTALTTYYIRLWAYNGAVSGNIGGICVSAAPPAIDASKRVGIGTGIPQANLDVNGDMIVRGGNPGAGKVLTSADANGTLSWQPLAAVPGSSGGSGFKAGNNFGGPISAPPCLGCVGMTDINWLNIDYDDANALSGSYFTAPSAGLYHFDAQITFSVNGVTSAAGQAVGINLLINGVNHTSYYPVNSSSNGAPVSASISVDAKLLAGETVTVQGYNLTPVAQSFFANSPGYKYFVFFSGHKIY